LEILVHVLETREVQPFGSFLETPKIGSNCETKIGDLMIGLDNLYLEKRNRRRRRRGKRKGGWTKMMEGG
jgi:hypothetical protein